MAKLALGKALKKKRVSKREFARRLKADSSTVFRYFRPGCNPTLDTLSRWAKVLGVRVRDLIEE